MRNQNIGILFAAAAVLILPLLAMQFSDEAAWDAIDFALAWVLLVGTALLYKLGTRQTTNTTYRAGVGVAIGTALVLVWMNLAVGLIGSEDNPANLLYGGVVAIGFIGAIIARFRPREMARAMFATALAQFLVPLIALSIWRPHITSVKGLLGVLVVNAFFVILFVASALLFRRAAPNMRGT